MESIYIILHLIAVVSLLVIAGMRPAHTRISQFELARRAKGGDAEARAELRRESLLSDVYSVQRVSVASLLVVVSLLGVMAYYWVIGLVIALLVALESNVISHFPPLQRQSQKIYEKIEPWLLRIVERFPSFVKLIQSVSPPVEDTTLNSKEELRHMVEQSGTILTDEERMTILSSLKFKNRQVKEIMTPKAVVYTIKKTEILGPIVLSDIHKAGFSRVPVVDKDIDHVIGILYAQNLLTIDGSKKRHARTAESAMESKVFYIKENQPLDQALAAFLKTHHHMFVVVNEF